MSTEVWYRKWRPRRFDDVAGQEHITRTLANAVAAGRIAHAYLFCGPRGTGKTSTARILAKAANCRHPEAGEPCGACLNCREMAEGRALDLVEMDAASNRGIDEIRSLRDKVGYSPTSSAYKVYLIDEVHELTAHAFDALLKTLEEPPPHVIFILATTEAERVPATITSRCQRYDFRRIRLPDVVSRLAQVCEGESVRLPQGAAELIARRATGSLRDAVNLLEQVVAAHGPQPVLSEVREALGAGGDDFAATIVRHALAGELAPAFGAIATARDEGIEPRQLQRAASERLRCMLLLKAGADASLELGEEALTELQVEAAACDIGGVLNLLRLIAAADFRSDALSPLPLELALAQAVLQPIVSRPQAATPEVPARIQPERPAIRPLPTANASPALRVAVPAQVPRAATSIISEMSGATNVPPRAPIAAPPAFPVDNGMEQAPPPATWADDGFGEALTVGRLQELMGSVYDRLKELRSRASALINSPCNVVELEEESITLAFKHDFLAARVKTEEAGKHVKDIEDAIESLSGHRYTVHVRVDPDVQRWVRPPATRGTSHLLDEAEKLGLRREASEPA
jgi:DNA polymerase-3 subunit gamma/tau